MRRLLLLALLLCAPLAQAADIPAGFPPSPVWLSESTPTAGTEVRIYTVVYDSSTDAIEGSITFSVDGVSIGSVPFSLAAGATAVKSLEWTATEGTHQVGASITAVDARSKNPILVANAVAATTTVSVLPTPETSGAVVAVTNATNLVSAAVASSSPLVSAATDTVVAVTEAIRTAGETFLETKLADPVASSTKKGSVLGAETYQADEAEETAQEPEGLVSTIARTLLPIFKYPAIFYPIFFTILVVVCWIVMKRLRHPGTPRTKGR